MDFQQDCLIGHIHIWLHYILLQYHKQVNMIAQFGEFTWKNLIRYFLGNIKRH